MTYNNAILFLKQTPGFPILLLVKHINNVYLRAKKLKKKEKKKNK